MLAKTSKLQRRGKFPRLVEGDKNTACQPTENCFTYFSLSKIHFYRQKLP